MDYFPTNLAHGKSFCNREKERQLLKQFIHHGRHTVLVAPRRYGKTSLIYQTLQEVDLPYVMIELTLAATLKDVETVLIKGVSDLLYPLLPASAKAKQKILGLFKWLNPELTLTATGQKLVFHPNWHTEGPVNSIVALLKKLDEAAQAANQRVVLVIDEFQQLSEIQESEKNTNFALEAAIRSAMQYAKMTTYLFSGSHRQMLLAMFNSRSRPFYHSCELMTIDRIEASSYVDFIQKRAEEQWGKVLESETMDAILRLTQLHAHYVNRLCGYFWLLGEYPSVKTLEAYWDVLVTSKKSELTEDLLSLSKNQRKLLAYVAIHSESHLSSSKVSSQLEMSEASIRQALKVLVSKDFVYFTKEDGYRVLDPALDTLLKRLQ